MRTLHVVAKAPRYSRARANATHEALDDLKAPAPIALASLGVTLTFDQLFDRIEGL